MVRPTVEELRSRALTRLTWPTEAEMVLRSIIPHGDGAKPEIIFGSIIVDIVSPKRNLLIEVDGSSHIGKERLDAQRDAWLMGFGFDVLRLRNADVLYRRDETALRIRQHRSGKAGYARFWGAMAAMERAGIYCSFDTAHALKPSTKNRYAQRGTK